MARLRHNVEQNAQHKLSFLGGIDLIPAGNSKNERLPFGVQQVRRSASSLNFSFEKIRIWAESGLSAPYSSKYLLCQRLLPMFSSDFDQCAHHTATGSGIDPSFRGIGETRPGDVQVNPWCVLDEFFE